MSRRRGRGELDAGDGKKGRCQVVGWKLRGLLLLSHAIAAHPNRALGCSEHQKQRLGVLIPVQPQLWSSSEQRISANESLSLPHSCFSSGLSLDTNGTRLHLTFDFRAQQLPGTGSNKLRGALVLMLFLCWSCPTETRTSRYLLLPDGASGLCCLSFCGGACGQICS